MADFDSGAEQIPEPPMSSGGQGTDLDATPPPDHESFVAARASGLAAIRFGLATRRKKR
jgi:hypothetical protein